jgi:hypothetical protein
MRTPLVGRHILKLFDLASCVHKYNFGHCCSCLCYVMWQSLKICSFLLMIFFTWPRGKSPVVLTSGDLEDHARELPPSFHLFRKHLLKNLIYNVQVWLASENCCRIERSDDATHPSARPCDVWFLEVADYTFCNYVCLWYCDMTAESQVSGRNSWLPLLGDTEVNTCPQQQILTMEEVMFSMLSMQRLITTNWTSHSQSEESSTTSWVVRQ